MDPATVALRAGWSGLSFLFGMWNCMPTTNRTRRPQGTPGHTGTSKAADSFGAPGQSHPAAQPWAGLADGAWQKLLALAVVLLCLSGCARPEPTLVVVVGGLGLSQLGDLRHAVIDQCPQAKVVSAGAWDGYKADITGIATAKPHDHIILVGHSLGCPAIAQAAEQLPKVDLAVFIDPAWDDFRLPRGVERYLWYQRTGFGLEREAHIVGAARTSTIEGGHNAIPHAPELIAGVVRAINSISISGGRKAETDHRQRATRNGRPLAAGSRDGANGS